MTIASTPDYFGLKKLPTGWSYPVSLSDLRRVMRECTRDLEVSFQRQPRRASEHRRAVERGSSIPILQAAYNNLDRPSSCVARDEQPWPPTWRINVYSIPSPMRSGLRDSLLTHGLPQLLVWLDRSRSETWLAESHRVSIVASARDGRYDTRLVE